MTRKQLLLYWTSTTLLSIGMFSGGIAQIMQAEPNKEGILQLGYPLYFMTIIGIWKVLGVITILLPKMKIFKEWAYAGFFFVLTGAVFSHIMSGDSYSELIAPITLLILTIVSWYIRPASRKIAFTY